MEELPTTTSSTTPPAKPRDTQQSRLTPNRPRSPLPGLSNSEPFLRFPRPSGNTQLAHWISSSNPDIMRPTTPFDDSDMAESTFELISGTDIESFDENNTESISESIGSLDFHRPDDVQSLTGTEHTLDDESLADDEVDALSRSVAQDDTTISLRHAEPASLQPASEDSDSDEEARSRTSLEYTQHSLKTPSILTPEASKIMERTPSNESKPDTPNMDYQRWMDNTLQAMTRGWDYVTDAMSTVLPGLIFAVVFSLLFSLLYPSAVEVTKFAEGVVTSTITATTTPIVIYTQQTTPTAAAPQQTTTTKGMGLIAINDDVTDEWLFGSKKPNIQFSPLGHGAIMVHVAPHVKKTWLKRKNCVLITATRSGEAVEMVFDPSDDGFLVKFPRKETHGVVELLIKATCRPAVTKAVKVHFGKGIMEEAYEMTKNLAHEISEMVPAAAQEAERCLVGAKKSFEAVSDTVASGMVTVSDDLMSRIKTSSTGMQKLVENLPRSFVKHAEEVVVKAQSFLDSVYEQASEAVRARSQIKVDVQNGILDARLYFLRSQISAKLWWLKTTGQTAEHEVYGEKAKDFMANKRREGRAKIRACFCDSEKDCTFAGWRKRSRCKRNHREGWDSYIF